jgi:hypothetical protein
VLAPKFTEAHWGEVGQDKSWGPQLCWEHYAALEQSGLLQVIVLFVDEAPEGYFISILGRPLHYGNQLVATSDMFYISETYRAAYAVRLFRAAKDFAKLAGAAKLYVHHKVYKDITPILNRLKFKPVEVVSSVSLED